jgi:hypothetical protein
MGYSEQVFRYFPGTSKYSIFYHSNVLGDPNIMDIHGYVNSNLVGGLYRRRSTSICMF